jgi:hypothetical protein
VRIELVRQLEQHSIAVHAYEIVADEVPRCGLVGIRPIVDIGFDDVRIVRGIQNCLLTRTVGADLVVLLL